MAEAPAGQASFGWVTSEAPAPSAGSGKRQRARSSSRRQASAAPDPQRSRANAGELALPPDNELWDVHAAARFLKRSVSWVYHKAEDGTLPVKRLGGWGVRFIPGELRTWVEQQSRRGDTQR